MIGWLALTLSSASRSCISANFSARPHNHTITRTGSDSVNHARLALSRAPHGNRHRPHSNSDSHRHPSGAPPPPPPQLPPALLVMPSLPCVLYVAGVTVALPLSLSLSVLCSRVCGTYKPSAEPSASGWLSDVRGVAAAACVIMAFLALNSTLSILNRYALGTLGLSFPVMLTATHMVLGSAIFAPLMLLHDSYATQHREVVGTRWRAFCVIAILNSLQIACNNAALVSIELSMNQVIRAMGPVAVAVIGVFVERKTPTEPELYSLIAISVGVMCTVFQAPSTQYRGMGLTWLSTLLQCLQISVSARVMAGGSKISPFQMTFYTGPLAFVALLPAALIMESDVLAEALTRKPAQALGFLLGSTVLAAAYNVVLFQALRTLSSVGTAVLGNIKIVLLVLITAVVMGELSLWTLWQKLGCLLTFTASGYYSYLRNRAS